MKAHFILFVLVTAAFSRCKGYKITGNGTARKKVIANKLIHGQHLTTAKKFSITTGASDFL